MSGHIVNNYASLEAVFVSGNASTLTDAQGKTYIDFVSGIGVNCLGHNHPSLVQAICEQARKQIHISNYYNSDVSLAFSSQLLQSTGMKKVFFANSGAEANEAAIKLARKYGARIAAQNAGKPKNIIVTLKKSFHGRTLATLSATGQDKFHPEHFAPYPQGFRHIAANDYEELETAFDDSVCAFFIECVQGEGGVNLIDEIWCQKAVAYAQSFGALIIVDEVQTGIGRTGSFLASEQLKIQPDAVTLAKGIAAGIPMGALLIGEKAESVFVAGDHQSTFGGNPLACAAGLVVLKEVHTPTFLQSVIEKGAYIRETIQNWQLSSIKEVRGKGLMIGIDIEAQAAAVQKKCLENGLCVSTAGERIIRFLPPLVITQKEIDEGLAIFKSCVQSARSV